MMQQTQTKEYDTKPQTFTRIYDEWVKQIQQQDKDRSPCLAVVSQRWVADEARGFVRSSTLSNYLNHLKHINKHLGKYGIDQIDKTTVNNFLLTLHNTESLSCGTIKAIASTLSSICRYGQENQLITKNPCKRLKMPTEHQTEAKVFSRAQQTKLEQTILKGKDPREIGILICLYTGIRLGELCALKWENFNSRQKTLHIAKSIGRVKLFVNSPTKTQIVESNPKTKKSNRVIPLPTFLSELLQALKKRSTGRYIIPSKNDTTKPLQPRTMQNVFKRLLTRANLPNTNFHALRHTFATRSIELGADIKSLSEILGHSNTSTTMNRYAHSFMEYKRKLMHKINSISIQKKPQVQGDKCKASKQIYAV